MSEFVILENKHGEYESGTKFEVYKKGPSTTIVSTAEGKRIILPNSKLVGEKKTESTPTTVEVTEEIYELSRKLQPGVSYDVDEVLEDHMDKSGKSERDAKSDILWIISQMKSGHRLIPAGLPTIPAEMSAAEKAILDDLLSKKDPSAFTDPGISGVTVTEEPEIAEPELGPNQVWFTDITGGRLPKTGINHIIDQYPEDHFPKEMRMDIPQVSKEHHWDCEVLEALVLCHKLREKGLITGMPGTGKSSSVRQFAAWIRQPYMRLGGRGDIEAASFLGSQTAEIHETEDGQVVSKLVFKAGMLTQGLNYNGFGYLVTIDEVWKIPSYIQMAMQHLYEKDGYLTIDDKPGDKSDKIVKPAPEFLMILTDNVKGTGDNFDKFAATQMQDTSSLDRIGINEELHYLDPKDEQEMLKNKFPSHDSKEIRKLVKFAGLIRNGYKEGDIALTLSPRGLIAILEMMAVGIPLDRAIDLAFINKIADETERIAVTDMKRTVGF